ncbi:PspC domain-containing protein [Paenibacillus sp. NPDC058071]|uniref:PspC domain-containing protein n=1 Tax=Paenibacillus sp. NPDC058071 TaxID=3346326 RepID=UPI0036DC9663
MKKLFRSTTDSKITGLCGGIGEWLGVDPTVIRVLTVVLAFFSFGAVLFAYFVISLLVPKAPFSDLNYTNYYHY